MYFPEHWYPPAAERIGPPVELGGDPLLATAAQQLDEFLDGRRTSFALPTARDGDPFQERVWALLAEIPYGDTVTYGALAQQLGNPGLARTVGRAVGRNPLSIVVPCHRVVGHDGGLAGYAGGVERKRRLLALEAAGS